MKNHVIFYSLLLLLSGCAKYSKQEIAHARYQYQQSQNKVDRLQSQLRNNQAYVNGQCTLPPKGKKPKPFVTNETEAKEYATAYCLSPVACDIAQLSDEVEIDSFTQRFLASEACGRLTDQLRADGLITNNTGVNLMESAADAGCNNQMGGIAGGIMKFLTCPTSAVIKVAKITQVESCLKNKHREFLKASKDWYSAPSKKRYACEKTQTQLATAQQELNQYSAIYKMMIEY